MNREEFMLSTDVIGRGFYCYHDDPENRFSEMLWDADKLRCPRCAKEWPYKLNEEAP